MSKVQGIIYAVSSAVAFGFVPVFAVIAYEGGTNVITALFFRFFFAALILLGILLYRGEKVKIQKKLLARLTYLSIIGYSATCVTLFLSYKYIAIGLATTMHFVYPAVVAVLSFFVFKERMKLEKMFSLILSILGVYILAGSAEAAVSAKGAALAIASGVFYSLYTIELGKEDIKAMDGLLLTFYVSLLSSAAIFVFGAVTGSFALTLKLPGVFAIIGLALICTVFAILAYSKAVKAIGPSDTAILSTFEPVTGVIMGMLVFGEKLSLRAAIGSLIIIISVMLFSYNQKADTQIVEASDISKS